MYQSQFIGALSTPSMVLRYAAAFFFVLVAVGLVYALVRLGKTLGQAELLLGDVNNEVVPLLKEATETLDNVNAELQKLDTVMDTVVDVTEKVDATTRAMEAAVSMPAKKAAAFGAGVSQAVSSMLGRREHGGHESASWSEDGAAWRRDTSAPAEGAASGQASSAYAPAASPEAPEPAPVESQPVPQSGAGADTEPVAAPQPGSDPQDTTPGEPGAVGT